MNKNVKASIAIGAGVILLMGGAGSLAYWNDTASVGPAAGSNTITAGSLDVEAVDAGEWTKAFHDGAGDEVVAPATLGSLSGVDIVPGNRLVYTQDFEVTASGDDLWFTIEATEGAVTAASADLEDAALAAQLDASEIEITNITGGNVALTGVTDDVYEIAAGTGPTTITVEWTIDFPFGTTVDNTAQLGAVNLGQGSVTLTQVAAR